MFLSFSLDDCIVLFVVCLSVWRKPLYSNFHVIFFSFVFHFKSFPEDYFVLNGCYTTLIRHHICTRERLHTATPSVHPRHHDNQMQPLVYRWRTKAANKNINANYCHLRKTATYTKFKCTSESLDSL